MKDVNPDKSGFFDKIDWAAFWTATLATFAVYFFTLGPSVGLEDSGELATAAVHLGVPHSPGYPFWTFCTWLFCKMFFWVKYMGYPSPAWAVSLFSAVAGAFAAGCIAMLICRSSRDFGGDGEDTLRPQDPLPRIALSGRSGAVVAFAGGVAGALTFALSPVEWSQSTIVEIYSLNALFLMWVFLLSYRWMRKPSDKILWTTAFVFGLGLTNYQVLLFAIVPLAILILFRNPAMFRDVFIYLVPLALCWQVIALGDVIRADRYQAGGVMPKHLPLASTSSCPSTAVLVLGIAAVVVSLAAAAVLRSRGDGERARSVMKWGGGGGVAVLLLSCTLFTGPCEWAAMLHAMPENPAPLVEPCRYAFVAAFAAGSVVLAAIAALQNDEIRLSDRGCRSFIAASAVSGIVAIGIALDVPAPDPAGYVGPGFPWGKSVFFFALALAALFAMCRFTPRGLCFAIPVAAFHIALFVLVRRGAMNGLNHPQTWWFWWPVAWNFILLALAWVTLPNGRSVAGAAFFAQLGVSFYAFMPIVSELRNPPMNWAYPRTWPGFKHALLRGQYDSIVFPHLGSAKEVLAFVAEKTRWYCSQIAEQFPDVLVPFSFVPFLFGWKLVPADRRRRFWQWMGAAAVCFLMMTILLIALAKVRGGVSDSSIQKVKFISSHAMIALWIGYGLFFSGFFAVRLAARRSARAAAAVAGAFSAAVLLTAFVSPLVSNYTDERMIFELGGCEQNGHTFGWQFGAYSMEGAREIARQIEADEEPLPDPDWPEPMEKYAFFFGGTDPGRFVPTYMVYAANLRPDIYIVTQNALADDKYMSVQRDLYGDEIWIPSALDCDRSFSEYLEEVDRGIAKVPPSGSIQSVNGRKQVVGSECVMQINTKIAKKMYERERSRRSFYVEESYAIDWMYEYLSPHGLIMKLEKDPTSYDPVLAAKDRDFWDWYVRRLLADPMFRRDFFAKKSLSALRRAIGGLYRRKGPQAAPDARQALREAFLLNQLFDGCHLYISNAMDEGRWSVARDAIENVMGVKDPTSPETASLRARLDYRQRIDGYIAALEAKRRSGKSTRLDDFNLAMCYRERGMSEKAVELMRPYVDAAGNPREILFVAYVMSEGRESAAAARVFDRYLKAVPDAEPAIWIQRAREYLRSGRRTAAVAAVLSAPMKVREFFVQEARDDFELTDIMIEIQKSKDRR